MATSFPRKNIIFLVRLMVIITTAYLFFFHHPPAKNGKNYGYAFIAFYLMTNLIVSQIPEKYFYDDKIFFGFILCDSILLPAGIYLSGYAGSDLYLMYFFIILLATISSRLEYLMMSTIIFFCHLRLAVISKGIFRRSDSHQLFAPDSVYYCHCNVFTDIS